MTLYCSQCGCEIEEGADFCYQCGALRQNAFDMDDDGNLRPASENATRVCPTCGFSNPFDDTVCGNCGASLPQVNSVRVPKALDTRDYIILAIGIIPGCLGVCGLGHLLYGRISRGLMFLVLSLILLYVEFSMGFSDTSTRMIMFRVTGFFLFFKSSMDLLEAAYYPKPSKKDSKEGE